MAVHRRREVTDADTVAEDRLAVQQQRLRIVERELHEPPLTPRSRWASSASRPMNPPGLSQAIVNASPASSGESPAEMSWPQLR